ncbi:tRNA A64-2'-O-ribosylphosphate transferase PWA37_000677 [Arxiozyma heterogenica]|uniref:Initiator tRNA phosphoribosyl transferase n=1 Tax=Arxiozyma heterogenica TaxID=278026 RepID=A0AAN7WMY3_9SACH|nr:hypothetical protein RI543_000565 [Kazachstania heterogenica]
MDANVLLSLDRVKKELRKDDRSLKNRIASILLDNQFLESEVIPMFPRYPVIPNERCGIWYCDPKKYEKTCYFKSTDGHTNQWNFSTRRLNFHLLPLLKDYPGIIIVDSTRRGKKMPDALSKTIPIWCAVLNHLMLKSKENNIDYNNLLFTPNETVSLSERSSIIEKLPKLSEQLERLKIVDGKTMYNDFKGKLLRPIWIYPGSDILESSKDIFTGEKIASEWFISQDSNFIPIILCTVSFQAQDGVEKRDGFTYHQGAGDDHELWSNGLEPDLFWAHIDQFKQFQDSNEEIERLVDELVLKDKMNRHLNRDFSTIAQSVPNIEIITKEIQLGVVIDGLLITKQLTYNLIDKFSQVIILSDTVTLQDDQLTDAKSLKIYKLRSGSKKSSKELRIKLIEIDQSIKPLLEQGSNLIKPILICCNTGEDMSIGVILMLLSKYYTMDWQIAPKDQTISISKSTIRQHLTQIISHLQGRNVNPSRATLNSVNSYLM